MNICIIYVLSGGFTMGTPACQTQLFYGDGVVTPHEVVYTSHLDSCWEGYASHIPRYRINFNHPRIRRIRHNNIRHRYRSRVRYHGKIKPHYRRHYRHHRSKRLKKRTIIRRYDKRGNLRKRTVKRRYF